MIFVTVGNATQGFRRLLNGVDELARQGFFGDEKIFMQTGHNAGFQSLACQCQPFISLADFQRHLTEATLVISHGGCTVFQALRAGKVPVIMPRMRKHGEHVNDHQVVFAETLARDGWIVPAYSPAELPEAILEARRRKPQPWPTGQIHQMVATAIDELLNTKKMDF